MPAIPGAAIGAAELSAKACELELASGKNDAAFCAKYLPDLLEGLDRFSDGLKEVFPKAARKRQTFHDPARVAAHS